MANILISGYYGFGNLGDELLLEAILNDLRQVDPRGKVTVLSARPLETAKRFGVRAVCRTDPFALMGEMRRCDLLLSGGGTLLQDATSRQSLWYYLTVLRLAGALQKPVVVYSQGIGPLRHPRHQELVGRALERAEVITLRDEASAGLLEQMGVRRPYAVTADPVLSLAEQSGERDERRIGWVLHGGLCGSRTLEVLGEAMMELNRQGYPSVLLPFYPRQDGGAVERLSTWGEAVEPERVRREIGRCGRVISMRLHGLILGAAVGSRVLALSDDPKVAGFLDGMGLPEGRLPERLTAGELVQEVLHRARQAEPHRLEEAKGRLEENRRQLKTLIMKRYKT